MDCKFTQIAVLHPNQIKSATDNNGDFSLDENNILFRAEFRDGHTSPGDWGVEKDQRIDEGADVTLLDVLEGRHPQPDDYFSKNGPRFYNYNTTPGNESWIAIDNIKRALNAGKDVKTVKAYRAIPKNIELDNFITGDWITLSHTYAKQHGEVRFGKDNYKIIKQDVDLENIWWDGNDINEWGYDDGEVLFRTKSGNLVGIHNISETKLLSAIKMGGLANPSMAVIDNINGSHTNFGEISLIAPSDLIDKKSGRNVGTWTADAYSPRYPHITNIVPNGVNKKFAKLVSSIGNKELESTLVYGMLDKAEEGLINFFESKYTKMAYLAQKGKVEIVNHKPVSGVGFASFPTLKSLNSSTMLIIHRPEETLHFPSNCNFSTLIMDGGVNPPGEELDGVPSNFVSKGFFQRARSYHQRPLSSGTL